MKLARRVRKPESIEELLARHSKLERWQRSHLKTLATVVGFLFLISGMLAFPAAASERLEVRAVIGVLASWAVGAACLAWLNGKSILRTDLRALADIDDSRALSALLNALIGSSFGILTSRREIETAVSRHLSTLRSDGARALPNEHLVFLCRLLNPKDADQRPYLVAAAIRALEQVGDAEAVPLVERLTREDIMEPVRGVAERCLPGLIERAKERLAAGTLLRPAAVGGEATLLRAASGSGSSDSLALLRAAPVEETATILLEQPSS